MLSQADRSKAAQILLTAEAERKPAVQLSKTFPGITIEDACAFPAPALPPQPGLPSARGRDRIGQ